MTPQWPKRSQRQLWALLEAMLRGERLSTIAALQYGCGACSQRINDLRRLGWTIVAESVKNSNGGWHFEYYIAQDAKYVACSVKNDPDSWSSGDYNVIADSGPEGHFER